MCELCIHSKQTRLIYLLISQRHIYYRFLPSFYTVLHFIWKTIIYTQAFAYSCSSLL